MATALFLREGIEIREVKAKAIEALSPSERNYYEQYQKLINAGGTNATLTNAGYGNLVALVQKIDKQVRVIRDQMRQQDPKLDYAVRVWY